MVLNKLPFERLKNHCIRSNNYELKLELSIEKTKNYNERIKK